MFKCTEIQKGSTSFFLGGKGLEHETNGPRILKAVSGHCLFCQQDNHTNHNNHHQLSLRHNPNPHIISC